MGEYGDMMLDGTCCATCGQILGSAVGFPRYCGDCLPFVPGSDSAAKVPCPHCKKRFFTKHSMQQHARAKHPAAQQRGGK